MYCQRGAQRVPRPKFGSQLCRGQKRGEKMENREKVQGLGSDGLLNYYREIPNFLEAGEPDFNSPETFFG